jgi:hypothetical protein
MMARILERETGRKAMSLAHVEAVEVFVSAESRTDPHRDMPRVDWLVSMRRVL